MNRRINKLMVAISIIICLVFIVLVFIINTYMKDNAIKILLSTIFSSIASIAGVALLWEIVAKKSFSADLYEMVQVSANIKESGIENIYYYKY